MYRLTKWVSGIVTYVGTFDAYGKGQVPADVTQQGVRQLLLSLAAYEDTGYTPWDIRAMKNELCQYCGKYKHAHEGTCYGCRWMVK